MQPATPPAPSPTVPNPKLSSLALYAIAGISVVVIASIFGFILFLSGMILSAQLWWMGVCGFIFAFLFYMVYAGTNDRKISRPLSAAFFVIGAGSFYGAIGTNADTSFGKLGWMIVLSIIVVIFLYLIFRMAREGERDAIRRSRRKVTP